MKYEPLGAWRAVFSGRLEGNNAEAEVLLKRAIALDPSDFSSYNNLGFFYHRQGLTKKAEPYYHKAIRLEPTFAKAHDNLGSLLESNGKYSEAEASYRRAVAAEPDHTKSHLNPALAKHRLGRQHDFVERDGAP